MALQVRPALRRQACGRLASRYTESPASKLAKRHTENAEAYQLYLKGVQSGSNV